MASRLEQLPTELLLGLIEYVPRTTDLKELCLTSKKIHGCALPHLYHTVEVDSCQRGDGEAERSLLQIGHPGLVHIRRLKVTAVYGVEECDGAARFLRRFLSILPQNGLREMSVIPRAVFTCCLELKSNS